jgi:hypothetical protein
MSEPQAVDLTAPEAARLIRSELAEASRAFQAADPQSAVAASACALGLALQLGPGPTEQVLLSILEEAQTLARRREAAALAALGPAMVELVTQVQEAGVLPSSAAMHAWASVVRELGALVGQVGLALTIAPEGRSGMIASARARAEQLDEVTRALFDLRGWLESMQINGT